MRWFLCWYLNSLISSSSSSMLSFLVVVCLTTPLERLFVKIFTYIFAFRLFLESREQWSDHPRFHFISWTNQLTLWLRSISYAGSRLSVFLKNNHYDLVYCSISCRSQWTMNNEHSLRIVCRRSAMNENIIFNWSHNHCSIHAAATARLL